MFIGDLQRRDARATNSVPRADECASARPCLRVGPMQLLGLCSNRDGRFVTRRVTCASAVVHVVVSPQCVQSGSTRTTPARPPDRTQPFDGLFKILSSMIRRDPPVSGLFCRTAGVEIVEVPDTGTSVRHGCAGGVHRLSGMVAPETTGCAR